MIKNKSQEAPFTLEHAAIVRRFEALFRTMASDFLLREQFVTNPAQLLSEYIYSKSISLQKASVTNQLIYSIMSNRRLLTWLRDYCNMCRGRMPSRNKFIVDFGRAVITSGGEHVIIALSRSSIEKEPIFDSDDVFLHLIFDAIGIFRNGALSGTEMSTGTGGTEMSTGTGGTEMSTGQVLSGTEMSTGTGGTEMSTGTGGTEMSTGQVLSGTEMSTGTGGTEMSTGTGGTEMSTGQVLSGTEMSTGTGGTEMSTGTGGTEMSTGQVLSGLFSSPYRVALEALVIYAIQLRDAGVLDIVE